MGRGQVRAECPLRAMCRGPSPCAIAVLARLSAHPARVRPHVSRDRLPPEPDGWTLSGWMRARRTEWGLAPPQSGPGPVEDSQGAGPGSNLGGLPSSSPARLPKRGESGRWKERAVLEWRRTDRRSAAGPAGGGRPKRPSFNAKHYQTSIAARCGPVSGSALFSSQRYVGRPTR